MDVSGEDELCGGSLGWGYGGSDAGEGGWEDFGVELFRDTMMNVYLCDPADHVVSQCVWSHD